MLRRFAVALLATTLLHTLDAQQIALPPHTVEGYLPNGMRYIIKSNNLPRHTVEFRLVMQVGSLQESDDQRGGAHFLEHMASNGMKQFPGRSMVDFFERQGMKYGRDINAFTGFDRTIYWYTVPTFYDASATIDTTLMIVRGILADLTFDEQRTRREQGVILEELRGYDTHDPFYALKIGNGRHAQRMPLGREEDIKRIDRNRLAEFHRQWYGPQFATLVVVGDVDAADMERRIRHHFTDLPRRGAKQLKQWPLTYAKGVQMMEIRDTLDRHSQMELMIPLHCIQPSTTAEAIEQRRDRMFERAIAHRLERAQVACTVTNQWYLADKSHFALTFTDDRKDSLLAHIARAAAEVEAMAKQGPTEAEMRQLADEATEKLFCDTLQSLSCKWCDDFVDHVVVNDHRIYLPADAERIRQGIGQTTPQQLKQRAKHLLAELKRHLLVAYSNNHGEPITKDEVMAAWNQGKADCSRFLTQAHNHATPADSSLTQPLQYFHGSTPVLSSKYSSTFEEVLPPVLATRHPVDSTLIGERKTYQELGLTEVNLRNGVRLLFRPTMDTDHRLQLMVLGRGGTSSLQDDDYYRLKDAVAYMDMGGIETIGVDSLLDVMGMANISMTIGMEDDWHELLASGNAKEAEALFNLVYEKMHHPRKDVEDFEESRQYEIDNWGQETLLGRMMQRDPHRQLHCCVDSAMGNIMVRREQRMEDVKELDLDSMAIYFRRLYTNPKGLTVIATGNYDLPTVERAAISTFSRMQCPDSVLAVNDEPVQPTCCMTRRMAGGAEGQTVLNYLFAGNYHPELRTTLTLKLMRDIIQQRMLAVLRERDNIVYSPYCDLFYRGLPQRTYYFWLNVAVKQENTERAQAALREIVADLQQRPVSQADLEKMKRSFIVTKRQQLSDVAPTEWRTCLTGLLQNGESLDDFEHYDEVLGSITAEEVRQAFNNYLDMDNCILIYQGK